MGFPRFGAFGRVVAVVLACSPTIHADERPAGPDDGIVIAAMPVVEAPSRRAAGPAFNCVVRAGQGGRLDFGIPTPAVLSGGNRGQEGCSPDESAIAALRPTRYQAVPSTRESLEGAARACLAGRREGDAAAPGSGSAAADGTLYFGSRRPGGRGASDLYRARPAGNGYAQPENLGLAVNSSAAELDLYVSPDQDVLVFASDRPGGFGGLDLYVSHRVVGGWSPARNLGPAVNSPDDEHCPQLSPDGRRLVFSRSDGGDFEVDAAILDDATP